MPRRKLSNRTIRYTIRFTPEESEEIVKNANISGLAFATYLRKRILGKHITAKTDLLLVHELRRIGGLLKNIHNESHGAYSEKTGEILDMLNLFVKKISDER
jgi:hypothetical protein